MTKEELLTQVIAQFQVVYLDGPTQAALLGQALRVCQSKMGPFSDIICEEGTVDTPADFLSVAVAMDANGRWQEVTRVQTAEIPETDDAPAVPATDKLQIVGQATVDTSVSPTLTIGGGSRFYGAGRTGSTAAVKPFRIYYFVDLSKSAQLPPLVEHQLFNYLSILLEIPNNTRARQTATAMGTQAEFPSDEELKQRKDLIEVDMEESQGMIPTAAVF